MGNNFFTVRSWGFTPELRFGGVNGITHHPDRLLLASRPRNTKEKIGAVFVQGRNKQIPVGRPSLAALSGGDGGPPYLRFLKDIAKTRYVRQMG